MKEDSKEIDKLLKMQHCLLTEYGKAIIRLNILCTILGFICLFLILKIYD